MATFIPEWKSASAREIQIKRVLEALGDDHVVRRPVREGCPAALFVQHRALGWMALAVSTAAFDELDGEQLFVSEQREGFENLLATWQHGIPSLIVMWSCSTEQARALNRQFVSRFGARIVSREQFTSIGPKLIHAMLAPVAAAVEQSLLGTYFPEIEIPLPCTARGVFHRDNSARLPRFFLDWDQEWAAKLDLEMPAEQRGTSRDFSVRLLNGVAGSGKTLIAIHRALLLAELFPRQRILVLIHNTPIVADLKDRLHRARGGLPRNVVMQTFFAWICRQWRRMFGVFPAIAEHEDVLELVRHHRLRLPGLSASDERLVAEIDFIDDSLISDEAGYLAARRAGRGFALRAAERRQVWALYEVVTEHLRRRHLHTWSALPRAVCLARERHAALERFHHILADEAQFFAPSWFQVVKLSLAPQGQLFLCADPQQGFLKNRLSWKSAGLDVSGRTKKLLRSYRSTQAILQAAAALLSGAVQPRTGDDFLDPDYAGMDAGKAPALVYAASPQDALDRLVNEIASLHDERNIPLGAFLVIYGRNVDRHALYVRLGQRLGAGRVWWFNERSQKKEPPQGHGQDYLRMAYVDSATGLEGAIVFLVGMEPLFFAEDMAALGDEERREEEARKLYMAMTRAGRRLVVVASQRLPQRAEEVFDVVGEGPSDQH
jgi:hypothetical protein